MASMKYLLLDIYPLALVALILFSMKKTDTTKSHIDYDYLSKETGQGLRGVLALIILLYHISQKIGDGIILKQIGNFGYLVVSVFYFLSGYGLQTQYMRSTDYKKRFLIYRLPKIIIPYIIAILLFWLMNHFILNEHYSLLDVLRSLVDGHPIVTYSWYIISILVYYVAFWMLMVFFGENHKKMLLFAFIWQLIYMTICWKMGYSEWWYSDSHLLIFGMVWACYEKKLLIILKNYYKYIFFLSLALLITLLYVKVNIYLPGILYMMVTLLIPICVVIEVICILLKGWVNNRMLMQLGGISLEIYLLQGLAIRGLRNNVIYIQNDFLWMTLVVFITVCLAWLLHAVSFRLYRCYRGAIDYKH